MNKDPYNNQVTYHDKWNTPANNAALKELENLIFDKSGASPSCPVSWAPEVLELFKTLESELGIAYNDSTMRGYYLQGNLTNWFLTQPIKNFFEAFNSNFLKTPKERIYDEKGKWTGNHKVRPFFTRVKSVFLAVHHSLGYGRRAFRVKYINPILNKIYKPKIVLGQVKEKYGSLRVYYSCSKAYEGWVDEQIAMCEVKIAAKGAYYPLENMWGYNTSWNVENQHDPDSYTVEHGTYKSGESYVSVTKTTHRRAMMQLGLDLKDIEQKYIMQQTTKTDPESDDK